MVNFTTFLVLNRRKKKRNCFIRNNIVAIVDSNGERIEIPEGSRVVILDDPGDRIIKGNSIRSCEKNERKIRAAKMQRISSSDKSTWKIEHYVKANTDELYLLLKERVLDHKTWGFLLSISPFVLFESCKIGYANGKKMTIEDISEAIGMSYKTARKYMKDLCENLIVAKWKGEYYVNPWIMYRGSVIDKFLITLFKDYYIRSRRMYWHEFVCL